MDEIVPVERVQDRIFVIRGCKVLLDSDLASLYGVPTKRLNEQVRRNLGRFPADFMFQLAEEEARCLRSQFATLDEEGRGQHRKYLPYVFTEQGVAMLSSVLHSERAVAVNIAIMRAFVKFRELAAEHKDVIRRLDSLESRYEGKFREVFQTLREILEPRSRPQERIGFRKKRG